MSVRSELREQAIERDGMVCQECSSRISDNVHECNPRKAHMSHIVGLGRGGTDTLDNVRMLCLDCHMVKEHMGGKVVRSKHG